MKNMSLWMVTVVAFTFSVYAEEPQSPPSKPVAETQEELTIEIVVNRFKEGNKEWDSGVGANPAPDVYGKIQLPDIDCEIFVHEDSYIVKQGCPTRELATKTPVNIQLWDRDTMRQDDVIAIGTIEYQGDPTETTIGSAQIRLWYLNPPEKSGN
ncbi:MAG: hypothetical protein BWK79_12830 [Beggiatoa sp. IS2]|nr:MAG: hypothetical protein BWK79_12830 [Beggiatoa sp. IS2]